MNVTLRPATPADARPCGVIMFEAFKTISEQHRFPPDFPDAETASGVLKFLFGHPAIYAVVAERDGDIVGSNVLDERNAIAGVGPITIAPREQNGSVGRKLMTNVLDRATERGFPGVRLLQAAYHGRSLALYTKLGFIPREPLSVMQGPALKTEIPGYRVRPATADDLAGCNELCMQVHGHHRGGELDDAISSGDARVVERDGRLVGYTTAIAFFGHAVGETSEALKALIAAADAFPGPGFMVPTRNAELLRWCLERGLKIVQPMTLMSTGLYNEPAGAWLPSIYY